MRAFLLIAPAVGCLYTNPDFDHEASGTTTDASGGASTGTGGGASTGTGGSATDSSAGPTSSASGSTTGASATTTTSAGTATGGDLSMPCPADPNLVACYRLEDANGGQALDGSGNDLHLTATDVTFEPGVEGNAARITPTSSLTRAVAPELAYEATRSFDLWFQADELAQSPQRLVHKANAIDVSLHPTGILRCETPAGKPESGPLEIQMWHHVACVDDGGVVMLYVDGLLVAEDSNALTDTTDLGAFNVGNSANGTSPTSGLVDLVRVWNRALSKAEICDMAGC